MLSLIHKVYMRSLFILHESTMSIQQIGHRCTTFDIHRKPQNTTSHMKLRFLTQPF